MARTKGTSAPEHRRLSMRAYLEALLEGVPLPATKDVLVKYAKSQGGGQAASELKRGLRSRRYSTLDEVGEELEPVQPARPRTKRVPRPESDLPPGGRAYGKDAA